MTMDQYFETFRKASVSSLQMQQEMFRQWMQQWPSTPWSAFGGSTEWLQRLQKRWMEVTAESLNRHRESLDSMYKSVIALIEQSLRLSESKTPEDYRSTVEELRHKMLETFKEQSEAQLREFQKDTEKWFDLLPKA
jgi:hypothetical protein